MNTPSVLAITLALTVSAAGSALAQGNSQHPRGQQDYNDCRNGPGNCAGPNQPQRPGRNNHRPNPPGYQEQERDGQRYGPPRHEHGMQHSERGAGPNQNYYRGGRLPPEYRTRQYVVNDWRGHHLSAPPRGCHWVQSGGDYLLVAITTGVILQLLLSN